MGASYTRQSSYADGDIIQASDSNNEFNQLLAAFAASTGHTHDGTDAEGGPITKLLGNTLTFGAGTAGTDITVTFDGESNDGVLKWMEDEDYFEFSDDILVASTEKLQFRDTAIYIHSSADGQLDLIADTEIQIAATTVDINGNVDISGTLTIGGAGISEAELEILDGATVTTTEINVLDGDTSASATTVADADRVVFNDAGTMKQVAVTDLAAYFDDEITAMPNLVTTAATTVGALNSGSITSGFGTIDTGSSTITTTGLITGGSLDIDDVLINGTTIGHTDDTDLITLANGVVTVAGEISVTTLDIGGTNVTSTAAELNILDGVTATATEINILDGDTTASSVTVADADRVVLNDGGTMKQVAVTDLSAYFDDEITAMPNLVTTAATTVGALNSGSITSGFGTIDTGSSTITTTGLITGGSLDIDDVVINGSTIGHTDDTDLITVASGIATIAGELSVTTLDIGGTNVTSTAAELNILDGVTSTAAELNILDGVTSTAAELNILDGVTSTAAELNILDGVTATAAELNYSDTGASVGTVVASKVVTADANKDVASFRNITLTGELDAGSLDVSGDADIDGTLEADAITVNGTALNTVIAGVTVANATLAATTTVTDSTANTNFPVVFHDESNALLDDTGALRYNPSTGELLVPKLTVAGTTTTVDTVTMNAANAIIFEGATADANETTLTIIDPTADRTINLPDQSGTIPLLAAASNTAITSTPDELNILDGATVVVGEINALDLGSTAVGNAIASKAVVLDSNKDFTGIRNLTATGTVAFGSISDGTITATAFVDEDDMSSNSATLIPTQQSVKAYVDSEITSAGGFTSFFIEDDDGTEVTIDNAKEIKFIGSGITTNFTDTSTGSDGDPFDLTFTVDAAQTGITSILATDLKIGEDDQTKIDFETADEIHFYAANVEQVYLGDNIFGPQSDSDVDLGSNSVRWKDAYVDSVTSTGNVVAGGTIEPGGDTSAGDNAAIGYTSAEGLILTGQGSTSDITLKNDADATVAFVPTGTDDLRFPDDAQIQMGASGDLVMYHNGSNSFIEDNGTGNFLITTNGNNITLMKNQAETMAVFKTDGACELYNDNVLKLTTASTGVDVTGGITASDGCTITTADNSAQLTLISTDADANAGPKLLLTRDSGSPADSDATGEISFNADDSAGNITEIAKIESSIIDVTNTEEDGRLLVRTMTAGTATSRLDFTNTETVFNDSSIDVNFRVESNDDANMLFVDGGNNRVGFGTATPGATLHASQSGNANAQLTIEAETNAYASIVRLLAANTGGGGYNGIQSFVAGDGTPQFEITGSESATEDTLSFHTGGSERARIDSSGRFAVGKVPDSNFNIGCELDPSGFLIASRTSNIPAFFNRTDTGAILWFGRNSANKGDISINSTGVTFNTTSDIRLKQDIEPLVATDKLMQMNPVSYAWKEDPNGPRSIGFIAQEMADVMPEAVSVDDSEEKMMSMDYGRITPILVSALQDAHKKIEELESRIAAMESK
mgnify:CR=1 FL=1